MWRFLWVCVHRLNRRFLGPPILGLDAAPMEDFWVRSRIHGSCGGVGRLFQQAIGFQPLSPGQESCQQWVLDGDFLPAVWYCIALSEHGELMTLGTVQRLDYQVVGPSPFSLACS